MRIAVIDMGTNTFNLLIVDLQSNDFSEVYSTKHPVKLGQKVFEEHVIDNNGISKILEVLKNYIDIAQTYSVEEIIAIATSSIRTAKNKEDILKTIKEKLNLDVKVIDGNREAELIYYANTFAIRNLQKEISNEKCLIMDIGGGSTEFIICNHKQHFWKQSFLLGMARLIDEIKPNDPITNDDIEKIHKYLDNSLHPLENKIREHKPKILVGSSGVFDSIVEMIEANIHSLQVNNSSCVVPLSYFYEIYKSILPLRYSERLKYKGLIEMRADMIVMSMVLIDYVLSKYNLQKMIVSFYSLKEGVIIEKLYQNKN
jgi:exopolyphosphatase/guanosine-5'-triphosphate,3'-diphosphate pyrophosphatase